MRRSVSVTGKDEVTAFDGHVAAKAAAQAGSIDRFAVVELGESPAAGRRVFFGVLDHKLYVGGVSRHERLLMAKHLVVFLGGDILPGEARDDGSVWKRKLTLTIGLHRDIVSEHGT